jgi:hypothetical protein
MKYLKIRIELGTSDSVFDIYYDSIGGGTRALLYDTGLPAIGLTNEDLELGEGVTVSVPDNATSIILTSDPKAFCSEIPGFNNETYTIPIGCISYTVSAPAGIFNYFYTDCNCNPVTATIDATYGYTEETFCALQDSVSAGVLTVVDNGYCLTPSPTPTQTSTPSPTGSITCIQVIDTVIAPEPQTGINNFFGVNISLSPYPVTENVTVTGYIRDDGNISNTYDFSITVIGGTQSGETANNVLTTGPADTATIFITGITPSVVTYAGNSVYICGLEPEPTPTMTPTPSTTPPCTNTIFTHGALRVTCSDFCNTNYLIGTTDCATETYFNLSIGDFIYGYSGQTGFLAYSNVSTDTNTGPFRIAEIDGTGEILGLYVCSGGSCIPL